MFENEKELKDVMEKGEVTAVTEEEMEGELRKKYPRLYKVTVEVDEIDKEFTFYFKKPTPLSFNRVLKTMSKKSLDSMKAFTLESIVEENRDQYEKDIEEYPALPMPFGQKLLALLGVSDNVSLKKL